MFIERVLTRVLTSPTISPQLSNPISVISTSRALRLIPAKCCREENQIISGAFCHDEAVFAANAFAGQQMPGRLDPRPNKVSRAALSSFPSSLVVRLFFLLPSDRNAKTIYSEELVSGNSKRSRSVSTVAWPVEAFLSLRSRVFSLFARIRGISTLSSCHGCFSNSRARGARK